MANVTVSVSQGVLNLTGNAALSVNNANSIVLTGSLADINATLATLKYTPAANFNGSDVLTIVSNDGTITDTDSVSITVTSVNDAPVANGPVGLATVLRTHRA